LLGRIPSDWDLTTDARPEEVQALFPRSIYENRFGTVVVRHGGAQYEITAFRRDVSYSDFRHPDAVVFGDSIEEDLARRDFTVNAMAWGARPGEEPALVDPHGGREDLALRLLRAVGDPDRRFGEDALRMARAVRLAATLEFEIEGRTFEASSGMPSWRTICPASAFAPSCSSCWPRRVRQRVCASWPTRACWRWWRRTWPASEA